jgi:hypothetical protein
MILFTEKRYYLICHETIGQVLSAIHPNDDTDSGSCCYKHYTIHRNLTQSNIC